VHSPPRCPTCGQPASEALGGPEHDWECRNEACPEYGQPVSADEPAITDVQVIVASPRPDATGRLEQELRSLDLRGIERPRGADAPPGAKGAAMEWAQLAVSVAGTLPPLVALARSFAKRNPQTEIVIRVEGRSDLPLDGTEADVPRAKAWLAEGD
jgi:hypothetical protein